MRHHKNNRKFGREKNQRSALVKSLVFALISEGKIKTTEEKAKEIRPVVEKLVTRAKNDTVANRRVIVSRLGGNVKKIDQLMNDIAPRYKDRSGGYTRIVKLPRRKSDGAAQAIIEFV